MTSIHRFTQQRKQRSPIATEKHEQNIEWHSVKNMQNYCLKTGRYKTQVTGHRLQVTGHRKCNKNIRHSAGLFMFIYLFHSGYVIIRHVFGIVHASRCSKTKRTKWQRFLLSFEYLEISKRSFVFAPREGAWNEVLRMERNSLVNAKSNIAK